MLTSNVDIDADVVVDGAVDVSATFVAHVDDSTWIILVNIAPTTSRRDWLSRSWGAAFRHQDSEVNDKGGAHVHGAVYDHVNDHVSANVDRIAGTAGTNFRATALAAFTQHGDAARSLDADA